MPDGHSVDIVHYFWLNAPTFGETMSVILSHLDAFVAQFHMHGTNSSTYKGMKEKSYRLNFSIMTDEAAGISLRENEFPLFADYSVSKATLLALSGVGEGWSEDALLPTFFRKSTVKGDRNFVGPQPSRAFFRVCATSRFDRDRNKTVLLKAREIAFLLAQYRTKSPFADGRPLRFPSAAQDGRTIRYVPPVLGDEPRPAFLTFMDPETPLAETESWLVVNQVICL